MISFEYNTNEPCYKCKKTNKDRYRLTINKYINTYCESCIKNDYFIYFNGFRKHINDRLCCIYKIMCIYTIKDISINLTKFIIMLYQLDNINSLFKNIRYKNYSSYDLKKINK